MPNKNIKDFLSANSLNLTTASILAIVGGELKRFTGQTIVIDSNGNVGIGTTSPSTKLHISGAGTTSASYTNGDAGAQTLYLQDTGLDAGNGGQILFGASSGIFAGIKGFLQNGNGPAGDLILQTRTTSGNVLERLRVDYKGNVGIGTTSPQTKLHVDGTIRYTNRPAAGTITALGFDANGDLKAASSSLRYKHDIQDYQKGLSKVMQLRPVSFKFNGETRTNAGFIAEEVNQLDLDEVMLYDEESKPDGIIYTNMICLLTKAIQELKAEIDILKNK